MTPDTPNDQQMQSWQRAEIVEAVILLVGLITYIAAYFYWRLI